MAVPWLDYSRYADGNGYQTDGSRQQWPWRDWLIQALNANKPFDQFTIEQLAGDMLPEATLQQKVATGFNRNHRINGEGGIIAEEWRVETVIDQWKPPAPHGWVSRSAAHVAMITSMIPCRSVNFTSSFPSSTTCLRPDAWPAKAATPNRW